MVLKSSIPLRPKGVIPQIKKGQSDIPEAFQHENQEKSQEKCAIWMPTLAESKIQDESTECGVNVNVLTQGLLQPPLSPVNAME